MKLDILAFGAHPDDIELGCGGTLLKHIAQGKSVGLVDMTQGELGTRGTAETRMVEAEEARRIMGAEVRENLKMADGFFQHTEENIRKIKQNKLANEYLWSVLLELIRNERRNLKIK